MRARGGEGWIRNTRMHRLKKFDSPALSLQGKRQSERASLPLQIVALQDCSLSFFVHVVGLSLVHLGTKSWPNATLLLLASHSDKQQHPPSEVRRVKAVLRPFSQCCRRGTWETGGQRLRLTLRDGLLEGGRIPEHHRRSGNEKNVQTKRCLRSFIMVLLVQLLFNLNQLFGTVPHCLHFHQVGAPESKEGSSSQPTRPSTYTPSPLPNVSVHRSTSGCCS